MAQIQGRYALTYEGVNAPTPPNFLFETRAPTPSDYIGIDIGTIWLHQIMIPGNPPTYTKSRPYMLVAKARQYGTWISLHGSGSSTSNVITTTYDTPGQTGVHIINEGTTVVEVYMWGAGNSGGGGIGGVDLGVAADGGGPGGGGGGFTHYETPVSFFGGAGASVSFSVANTTPAVPGKDDGDPTYIPGNIGETTKFGNIETMTTCLNLNSTPQYLPWDSNAIITLSQIGGGMVDTGSVIDFGTEFCLFNLITANSPNKNVTNGTWPYIGHFGNEATNTSPVILDLVGTSLPTGGGGGGYYSTLNGTLPPTNGGSLLSGPSSTLLLVGGVAGTAMAPNGLNGLDGNTVDSFMAGGSGGGGGYFSSVGTGGNGGNGGYPGGGGGGGGGGRVKGGDSGTGGGGMLIVLEYI